MTSASRSPDASRQPFAVALFPLRTVLFPGGLLPLKIFEQRYIDMIKTCLKDERPFGVCLIMLLRPSISVASLASTDAPP